MPVSLLKAMISKSGTSKELSSRLCGNVPADIGLKVSFLNPAPRSELPATTSRPTGKGAPLTQHPGSPPAIKNY